MESTIMMVTPEMAREWLKMNIDNNRRVSARMVEQYAQDMKAGRWQLNGEAICFSESGKLLDGQHRLHGVIKANRPVMMYVTFGVPDTVSIYDSGYNRRPENMLQMMGVDVNRKHISAARFLLEKVSPRVSMGQVEQFVAENIGTLNDAVALSSKRYNNHHFFQKAPIAAAAWVILADGYSREVIDRFFDIAASGFYEKDDETAAIAFRNYVLSESAALRGSYRKYRASEFDACCKAFSDYYVSKPRRRQYGIKDFAKCDIFSGSRAEAILKQYTTAPASGTESAETASDAECTDADSKINPDDRRAGIILRNARLDKGWSIAELAQFTGFDVSTILNFETGAYHISDNANNSFKYALGCDVRAEVTA